MMQNGKYIQLGDGVDISYKNIRKLIGKTFRNLRLEEKEKVLLTNIKVRQEG